VPISQWTCVQCSCHRTPTLYRSSVFKWFQPILLLAQRHCVVAILTWASDKTTKSTLHVSSTQIQEENKETFARDTSALLPGSVLYPIWSSLERATWTSQISLESGNIAINSVMVGFGRQTPTKRQADDWHKENQPRPMNSSGGPHTSDASLADPLHGAGKTMRDYVDSMDSAFPAGPRSHGPTTQPEGKFQQQRKSYIQI
jgi:hypothetical protein